ncbi:MAG: phosphoribosylformylglycinamidine synthase II [Bacteroidetes bacterium GWE2_29_8]|nr:MAG: phosphoribosylformylglycinamidine synthase II [Bacteroidetes bacterium GWE2_29_8]OFY17633.1 MAG: phosphoribosylformylglycinamidine synthase II [Bacteroidetes bacterium GWF2_29_10]
MKYNKEKVDVEVAGKLGLLPKEFEKIKEILGREPNYTELSMYSVMWSEHCSYKNSIFWLKKLPKEGKQMLVGAGEENAGLVDLGDGIGCCFKIESHNHPSAVEPYQGAATGVGGINRDIFTMGARPIAQLNSLRFGNINSEKTKWLVKGVVKGIGDYGNAFGVPVVGGEVYFDDCYNVNPLVNAMSVGIVKKENVVSATSYGVGNPVFIVGSSTGKDGIHGATFASEDITEKSSEKLPSVQVGDPFQEKLLLEASLELIKTGVVIGMQDMGAAGITCSTSEMSAKGKHAMIIHLDKVPLRQNDMQPFEILLSESQERMLVVVKKGMEDIAKNVFDKWDLNCVEIGEVIEGDISKYYVGDELVAAVSSDSLVLGGGAPVYQREFKEPSYFKEIEKYDIEKIAVPENLIEVAKSLTANVNICSRQWVAEQYDTMVGTKNMTTNRPSDAAVVNIKGTKKAIALSVDCNSRYVMADPVIGTEIAVSESARNIICSGGVPLAITNCLNFGNPYNPEVYWQFVGAIKGMSAACKKFNAPVTGGNVSFYNQSLIDGKEEPVYPTPVIGMLGVLEDKQKIMTLDFKNEGDYIVLIGKTRNDISSSEYLYNYHGVKLSPPPYFNLEEEHFNLSIIQNIIKQDLILSAHDISDGGLFITLIESCFNNNLGFDIKTDREIRKDAFLFGESQSRVVISVSGDKLQRLQNILDISFVDYFILGNVIKNGDIVINYDNFGNIKEYRELYYNTLASKLNG